MDPISQLFGSFFGLLLLVAVLVWLCTPLVWTWLLFRFFRDTHSMAESLQWICWAQRKVAESEPAPKPAAMLSQFGR